jgi:hypothetical protein
MYKEPVAAKPMNMDWIYVIMYFIIGFLFIYGMVKGMTKIFAYINGRSEVGVPPTTP